MYQCNQTFELGGKCSEIQLAEISNHSTHTTCPVIMAMTSWIMVHMIYHEKSDWSWEHLIDIQLHVKLTWTWPNICCRYCIYHFKFKVCLNSRPLLERSVIFCMIKDVKWNNHWIFFPMMKNHMKNQPLCLLSAFSFGFGR